VRVTCDSASIISSHKQRIAAQRLESVLLAMVAADVAANANVDALAAAVAAVALDTHVARQHMQRGEEARVCGRRDDALRWYTAGVAWLHQQLYNDPTAPPSQTAQLLLVQLLTHQSSCLLLKDDRRGALDCADRAIALMVELPQHVRDGEVERARLDELQRLRARAQHAHSLCFMSDFADNDALRAHLRACSRCNCFLPPADSQPSSARARLEHAVQQCGMEPVATLLQLSSKHLSLHLQQPDDVAPAAAGIEEAVWDAIAFVSSRMHDSFCIVSLADDTFWSLERRAAAQLQRATELLARCNWASAAACCFVARKSLARNGHIPAEPPLCLLYCQLARSLTLAYMHVGCLDDAHDVASQASRALDAAVDEQRLLAEQLIELINTLDESEELEAHHGEPAACGVICLTDEVAAQHMRVCRKCRCFFPMPDGGIPPVRTRLQRLESVLAPAASSETRFEATARLLGGGVSAAAVRSVVLDNETAVAAAVTVRQRFHAKVQLISTVLPGICHAFAHPGAADARLPFDITLLSAHTQSPYLMVQAPVNSTGDLYHQLAYIFWCRAAHAAPCRVVLCRDATQTTRDASERALTFVRQLGLAACFEDREVLGNGSQPAARQVKAETALAATHMSIIDSPPSR